MGKLILRMLAVCSILLLSRIEADVTQQEEFLEISKITPMTAAVGSDIEVRLSRVISPGEWKELMIAMEKRSPVFFDNIPAEIVSIGENSIRVTVPSGLPSGSFPDVTIRYDRFVSPPFKTFQVTPFEITKILPSPAKPGSKVEIAISKRIDVDISDVRVAFNKDLVKVIEITPEIITVEVPENLSPGSNPVVFVYLGDERSELYDGFTVESSWIRKMSPILAFVIGILLISTIIISTIIRPIIFRRMRAAKTRREMSTEISDVSTTDVSIQLPQPEPPEGLVRDCVERNCVLYAGAGLSAQAGFPTWFKFVRDLLKWAINEEFVDSDFGDSLHSALKNKEADSVADSIVSAIQSKDALPSLHKYLQSVFIDRSPPLPQSFRFLKEIGFSAVLTTNFDNLLEKAFEDKNVCTPMNTDDLEDTLSMRKQFILKLYGTLGKPDSVMVAPAQYEASIADNKPFAEFMQKLFYSRTILFIGASLEGIETYLEGIKFREHSRSPHYALVAVTGSAWKAKADLLMRRYTIQVLPFTPSEDYSELTQFLANLVQQVKKARERASQRPELQDIRKRELMCLKRIRFENIGPFDDVEIELDRRWNILLGDNGVGKSTILKAIAIGICGESASPYADRLIKAGNNHAKIILETNEGKEYLTEISKINGGVEIKSIPGRLFEAERWLAVGFPPMRMITWEHLKGPKPEEGRRRFTPDDLLPLIKGETDPRLDELKQWIVNLDYKISKGTRNDRYKKLFEQFFQIVNRLTEDVTFQFKHIDPHTHRVMVTTDDGVVPIESVSQGTTSMIGWVGVLLQRLYEIYGDSKDPREQYALVLVDEIDVHMHPAWQQSLIPNLQKVFPNAQFVATTHSPLIVSGMPINKVCRLERDEHGKVVRLQVDEDMTMGRADQVLTGNLFGLSTTLDHITRKEIKNYQKLLGKRSRTEQEDNDFRRLEQILEFRIPVPQETPAERRAQELLEVLLRTQVGDKYPEMQKQLLEKADKLLEQVRKEDRKRFK